MIEQKYSCTFFVSSILQGAGAGHSGHLYNMQGCLRVKKVRCCCFIQTFPLIKTSALESTGAVHVKSVRSLLQLDYWNLGN